ncbi:cytochrome c5 family protein [Solimonas sp. C16B3]|uniref:Cytochrome c5 family protein n=2 Tax=Solimonas marina TaxID=2714601 RepID=A0A970B5S5_9GAMM|nr:c-type cytochrome [Solimonas marina]NKF22028.1 cytochrome c5 family protein [Solimonas marina]
MAVLFGIFFVCIIAARWLDRGDEHDEPGAKARLEARIAPVGQVVTDPSVLVKMAAQTQTSRPAMTGEQVYSKVCTGCHAAGVLGAPKVGDKAAWSERLKAQDGVDGLLKKAESGLNAMPPRGGDASLSDDELKGAIEYMLKQTGL